MLIMTVIVNFKKLYLFSMYTILKLLVLERITIEMKNLDLMILKLSINRKSWQEHMFFYVYNNWELTFTAVI